MADGGRAAYCARALGPETGSRAPQPNLAPSDSTLHQRYASETNSYNTDGLSSVAQGASTGERPQDRQTVKPDENCHGSAAVPSMVNGEVASEAVAPSDTEDIANTALYFCSPLADIVTGQSIAVDGGSSTSVNY